MTHLEDAVKSAIERCPNCWLPWDDHPQRRCEACSSGYETDEPHCHQYADVASFLYRYDRGVFHDRRIVP